MSSLNAVEALRSTGCHVVGMVAIFTYGFQHAIENFRTYQCPLYTLSDYNHLIDVAVKEGYINQEDIHSLKSWREDPANWNVFV